MKQKTNSIIEVPHTVVLLSLLLIVISPTELIAKTEKYYYVLCFVPLIIWFIGNNLSIKRNYYVYLLVYIVIVLSSTLWSPNNSSFRTSFVKLVTLSFLFLQLQYDYSKKEKDIIKNAMIIQFLLLFFVIVLFGYRDWDSRLWVAHGDVRTDSNSICSWLIIPFCYIFEKIISSKHKTLYLILLLLNIYLMLQLLSRSGLIVYIVCIILIALYHSSNLLKKYPVRALICLFVLIIALFIIYKNIPEKFMERINNSNTASLGGRSTIWGQLFQITKEHPFRLLLGFGESATVYYTGHVAHNLYIEVLFNQGLLGLFCILAFTINLLKTSWKTDRYTAIALIGIIIISSSLSELTSRPVMLSYFLSGIKISNKETT